MPKKCKLASKGARTPSVFGGSQSCLSSVSLLKKKREYSLRLCVVEICQWNERMKNSMQPYAMAIHLPGGSECLGLLILYKKEKHRLFVCVW